MFNKFLLPTLTKTAATAPKDSVRVVWLSSLIASFVPDGGIILDSQTGGPKVLKNAMENYMQSKIGNLFFAKELARKDSESGVLHLVSGSFGAVIPESRLTLAIEREPGSHED